MMTNAGRTERSAEELRNTAHDAFRSLNATARVVILFRPNHRPVVHLLRPPDWQRLLVGVHCAEGGLLECPNVTLSYAYYTARASEAAHKTRWIRAEGYFLHVGSESHGPRRGGRGARSDGWLDPGTGTPTSVRQIHTPVVGRRGPWESKQRAARAGAQDIQTHTRPRTPASIRSSGANTSPSRGVPVAAADTAPCRCSWAATTSPPARTHARH